MARNGVAANLLMVFLLFAGIVALGSLVQEVFPEFSLDTVEITVSYPGATPEEIEESILQKIEEQVEAVEGVDEITGTAAEGFGTVMVELKSSADISKALDDIKAEVDQITSFPAEAENPEIREVTNRLSVIRILVHGNASERAIKETAYRLEDALAALPEVSFVETTGIRDYEISIEFDRSRLQAYGLTLQDVAARVRAGSLDLPAGSIETDTEQVRVRTLGQNYTQQQFEDIVLISQPDGTEIRLGQVARIVDGFEDADLETRYDSQPAAMVEVFRTSDERVLDIVDAVMPYLDEFRPTLPAGLEVSVWEDSAEMLQDRIDLLVKNAGLGLLLVVIALALFLHIRLAFWAAVGIFIAFVGTLAIMYVLGVSINQMSLFGFILAIGIVVDDAIVVGENIFAEREKGRRGITAAIIGARRIARPVTFAILTTIVAFIPLLFVPGLIGSFLDPIPFVVISVLALSLVEALFILPNHLSHLPAPGTPPRFAFLQKLEDLRQGIDERLKRFTDGPLRRALEFATGSPPIIISTALAAIILTVSLVPAGILRTEFLPDVEGDYIISRIELPEGSAFADTRRVVVQVEAGAREAINRLQSERDPDDDTPDLLAGMYTVIGQQNAQRGPDGQTGQQSPHLATVALRLPSAANREISALVVEDQWRQSVGDIPMTKSLTFSANLVDIGAAVQVEVSHPNNHLLPEISAQLVNELNTIAGVFDVESDLDQGLKEVQLELKPAARNLGITLDYLATSVRAAFFGQEALRIQRGREEVRVYVRLPESQRNAIEDVREFQIRTPGGRFVPLSELADVEIGRSPARIQRKDGQRVVTVTADVDARVVTGNQVAQTLENDIIPALAETYPGLSHAFGGEQEEQAQSFGALGQMFLLVLCVIYALLAIPFRSYVQPLVVMAAIPFGMIGAAIGLLLLDLSLGMLSIFGIIGLSGVVVNNSLVMIDFINEKRRDGMPAREAIIEGSLERFRPIMLTALTTFLSVTPLVLETSFQAQFLIPMAASIGFGILFATGILMLLVPALAMVEYRLVGARRDRKESREDTELATP